MTPTSFAQAYGPLADRASKATGVNRWVILTQWAVETGWGTSALAVSWHNLAGIRWYGRIAQRFHVGGLPGKAGTGFAGYANFDAFVSDYVYVMGLSYYAKVRAGRTIGGQLAALAASPWDAGHYRDATGTVGGSLLAAYRTLMAATATNTTRHYTVVRGDSLWAIAQRVYGNGALFGRIAAANGISAPWIIRIGQSLVIP